MTKILGYILGIIGLAVVVLSINTSIINLPLISSINSTYIMIAGIVIVIVGVALLLGKKSAKQDEEVPIFHGEGKKRKIVGYRRMK